MKVPLVGGPPRWQSFPPTARYLTGFFAPNTSHLAARLWVRYFDFQGVGPPPVYWSGKIGVHSAVEAKCYNWGIVLSRYRYLKQRKAKRESWLVDVLKHELLHWAGYPHNKAFYDYLSAMGGSY